MFYVGGGVESLRRLNRSPKCTADYSVTLHTYMDSLPSCNRYKVSLADSIWFKDDDRLKVEGDFLQTNADYYDQKKEKSEKELKREKGRKKGERRRKREKESKEKRTIL